jgi:chromosome segregation protein
VRLKSVTLKGFKSFPERTHLAFGPGVSVVVGPNGSGKSNITDAVLWAMGEQSPLAVRGSSMQDVIFGGAPGVQARTAAEVEIVLENSNGGIDLPLSEISIVRRLDRTGEGSYQLNGARCRLVDVIEALSDTGLGKETHSVISQGRVEEIVTSKPRDRRLLIEEAAGLGKHRKRRRRAQLKLERTQQNLDRALDIEREARTRLRPLKRQAEAAEQHARLERQMLEARLQLARDRARSAAEHLREAEDRVAAARSARAEVERRLQDTIERRGAAERALAERAERRDALSARVYEARSARERLQLRGERVADLALELRHRMRAAEQETQGLSAEAAAAEPGAAPDEGEDRITALQAELDELERRREQELERDLRGLQGEAERHAARAAELEQSLSAAREERERAEEMVAKAREGGVWSATWQEVRRVIEAGLQEALREGDEHSRELALDRAIARAEEVARGVVEYALKGVHAAEQARDAHERELREAERALDEASEAHRRAEWLIAQRRAAAEEGPLALRAAQLRGELAAEGRRAQEIARGRAARAQRIEALRERRRRDAELLPLCQRLEASIEASAQAVARRLAAVQDELAGDSAAGEQMAADLRACAGEEAEIHNELRGTSEGVTEAEVAAQRLRDQAAEAELELAELARRLQLPDEAEADPGRQALSEEEAQAITARIERVSRRREQLGPVNPLAGEEYAQAVEHVEELESRREDLETALRELRALIADTDRQIQQSFQATFQAAADNFELLAGDLFPGGSGRLRLVREEPPVRAVLGGQDLDREGGDRAASPAAHEEAAQEEAAAQDEEATQHGEGDEQDTVGVEIEITPAGKSAKRLSLLSGGEKSMTALAFLFSVFLARPCPFYILDEVEAALDDLNLDRFLALLRRYSDRAQFIVITHQKRTMEAADWLYGVSMGSDGVSKVLSRRLPPPGVAPAEVAGAA